MIPLSGSRTDSRSDQGFRSVNCGYYSRKMETELLRTFLVVSEELNFTRAAERLHVSQPSLSRRVRELERILDGRLFERGPRKVELTPLGAALLPGAHELLTQVELFVVSGRSGLHDTLEPL